MIFLATEFATEMACYYSAVARGRELRYIGWDEFEKKVQRQGHFSKLKSVHHGPLSPLPVDAFADSSVLPHYGFRRGGSYLSSAPRPHGAALPMDALSLVDGGSCGIAAGPPMDAFSLVDGGSGVGSHPSSALDLLHRHYRIDVAAVYLSFFGRITG